MENVTGNEILSVIDGMTIKNTDRVRISIMLHDVVFDNQRAIFDLIQLGHIRSASALLRVLFEAHVKAIWIYYCATDEQIIQFKKDNVKSKINSKNNIQFQEMISDIEATNPHLNGTLDKFKKYHWKGLNSLTHSGVMQFSYKLVNGEISKKHDKEYSGKILDFSERFAISSLGNVGKIVGNIQILKCHIKLADKRLGIAI